MNNTIKAVIAAVFMVAIGNGMNAMSTRKKGVSKITRMHRSDFVGKKAPAKTGAVKGRRAGVSKITRRYRSGFVGKKAPMKTITMVKGEHVKVVDDSSEESALVRDPKLLESDSSSFYTSSSDSESSEVDADNNTSSDDSSTLVTLESSEETASRDSELIGQSLGGLTVSEYLKQSR